jgi:hypothetical protein
MDTHFARRQFAFSRSSWGVGRRTSPESSTPIAGGVPLRSNLNLHADLSAREGEVYCATSRSQQIHLAGFARVARPRPRKITRRVAENGTISRAAAITRYDPDAGWRAVQAEGAGEQ